MADTDNFNVLLVPLFLVIGHVTTFLIPDGLQRVHTNVGDIQGHLANVQFDGTTYQARKFLGIPYAKPPVGDLRFRKPEPLTTLPHLPFNAMKMGPICPQPYSELNGLTSSEDCLFLNIFTPALSSDEAVTLPSKAVMVWIHGGGFYGGSADIFDGSILSTNNDVIVVTMNYRLGPLGFLSTHDKNAPGNYGLWDQQLAIKWVYDNIAAFGGDPNNILIFGQSAGSSSVVYQTLFPGNKGLVKRAIAESGTIAAWGIDRIDTNRQKSVDFAKSVDCYNNRHINTTCLRSKSAEEMRIASEKYYIDMTRIFNSWMPVFDNEFVLANTASILKDMSSTEFSTSYTDVFHSIDFMIGACNMDGLVYLPIWLAEMNKTAPLNGQYGFSSKQFVDIVIPMITQAVLTENPNQLVLDAIKYEYTNWDDPHNATKMLKTLVDITTDYALNAPSILTANDHQLGTKATYVYQFATAPPGKNSFQTVPPALKTDTAASHSDELGFVFGFPDAITGLLRYTASDVSAEQVRVSKAIMAMWANFAKTGNPNKPADLQQIFSGLVWPEYDSTDGKYLEITPTMSAQSVKTRLAAQAVQFWNNLIPHLQTFSKV